MKKDIKELSINPINPRRIVLGQKRRLQQSIMLFPKMLTYRDIIVNKENVVLAGNQRTTILKEILTSTPMDWMVILQENEKWQEMTEKQRDAIIEYWKVWVENPIIDVTVADLTEEEEKELIIKDNNEFGEFNYEKLQQIYDEINLVNFGFDEGLFYNPDDDDTVMTKIKGSTPKKINMLTFGKNVVSVTKEEYDTLVNRYNDYVDETGVNFGFVKSLLESSGVDDANDSDNDDTVFEMPQ
ncbi:hypothetical protein E4T81_12510 [Barnesiella sp. WM24]|uniref:hypothetical protein n=1 Tax=Barnesiella sp. WM24 TaxID=2558278 RepID=UPI0010720C97|nr:hypothetical protein [Barnesiella sp. WM24]TFU92405.1 hypothetical protein E4T81_12510 [Barnesiella sp. WM24]